MIHGLILAGGESKRIGTPKALLKINEETFVERITNVLHHNGIQNIILVAGAHYKQIGAQVKSAKIVFNTEYRLGQFSSLQTGLRAIPKEIEFVIVWPVDLPLVRKETVATLLQTAKNPITVPIYHGRKGHPVIYNTETITKILTMEPTHTGKDLFEYFKDRVDLINGEDPAVLIDIDTPEDYEKYITRGDLSLPT